MIVEPSPERAAEIARNRRRIAGEKRVVNRVIKDLLAAGYTLSVDYREDDLPVKDSTSFREVSQAMMACDEEWIIARKDGKSSWVFFVYGNDAWEVICDYTIDLEEVLKGAFDLGNKIERRGR